MLSKKSNTQLIAYNNGVQKCRIRSKGASFCLALLSILTFILIKVYPPFMQAFGLSASMWACASFAALGLFYIAIFLPETKGKSMCKEDA